uniref:Histone deacetylase interacting domain-containing protein n=1 Tax=Guillardia theta TaxID=55529 RepID=A0A7S4KUV8_GUITH|mmetsp:Transcript_31494/g.100789  ORF Transcript_31494/g.100789 Transcript_31494/m.100789 type:complete len:541 (+) Transcript_31494:184-1806(+)
MSDSKPNIQTALAFLKQVKSEMPTEYDTFLEILTQFRSKNVNAEMVVTVVIEMLIGREYLLQGFSQFLPPACRDCLMQRFFSPSKDENLRTSRSAKHEGDEMSSPEKSDGEKHKGKRRGFDQSSLIGSLPLEQKRRRESVGEMDLRPNAFLNSYAGMGKRMTQQQIYQAQLKKTIAPRKLADMWERLEKRIEKRIEQMEAAGASWIPSIHVDEILKGEVPAQVVEQVKVAGVIKIRGVVAKAKALEMNEGMMADLSHYLKVDPKKPESYETIYNDENPKAFTFGGVQEMYYTRGQFEARQDEKMHKVRVWLNHLWGYREKKSKKLLFLPDVETTYIDRWRHRLPGYDKQTGMKEHIDNGAMCRWADPAWQEVYQEIMEGRLEDYDAWDVGRRTETSGSFFRSFQGWLALSPQGPTDGTLEVIPMVTEAMAYVLLRPFQEDVPVHQFCGVSDTGGATPSRSPAGGMLRSSRPRFLSGPSTPGTRSGGIPTSSMASKRITPALSPATCSTSPPLPYAHRTRGTLPSSEQRFFAATLLLDSQT